MKQKPLRESEVMSQVKLSWYGLALIPIFVLMLGGLGGYIHPVFAVIGLFALFFWLFSLLFVLYGKWKYRRRPDLR